MEVLDLRHFTSADLRPLLEDEVKVWGDLLCWDYSGSAEMILRYMDAKFLPGYAAVSRGKVFGYSFFVYESNKGVIGDLFVNQGENGVSQQQVETRLLTHVIETLQQSPGIHRIEAQLLAHETGAASEPFISQGFSQHARLFMALPLAGARIVEKVLTPEIELRRWTEQDYQHAASVITAAYRAHVDSEINDQYRTLSGSLRFLNNIIRFPGCGTFDPESSFVAVHKRTHTLVGVILCSRVRYDTGHVTQVCVIPEYRGFGLGKALLAASVRNLTQRKFAALSLTVTEANSPAVELYKRLGFDSKRVFDAFVWEG
ncbi:MAG TPA: GNAT family N-acetyltransferase [Terriglobales bacterium]|nr:GNAT family N-acetyltransferase [Terriglobales bacterium]